MGSQFALRKGTRRRSRMKLYILLIAAVIACVKAQDTFFCPDGWELFQHEGKTDECSCYLFPTTLARVSHGDAQLLCAGHDAKLAEPVDGAPNNYWIVEQLQQRLYENNKIEDTEDLEGPHYEDQWWMEENLTQSMILTIPASGFGKV